ncbi:MAG: hypothetical protein IPM64_02935 [Phycisphaerales bacterium]|nr:hypothetical protein [Phycisphaerales bacterium]
MATKALEVTIRLNNVQYEKVPFEQACSLFIGYARAGKDAGKRLWALNRDQWATAFLSELTGGRARLPGHGEWADVEAWFTSALAAYRAGNEVKARTSLSRGAAMLEVVTEKQMAYRRCIDRGATRTKLVLVVVVFAAGAVISGGVGVKLSSLAAGAGASAGFTLITSAADQTYAKHIGLEKSYDIVGIVRDTAASFVGSLIGGKLASMFLAKLQARLLDPRRLSDLDLFQAAWVAANVALPRVTPGEIFAANAGFGTGAELMIRLVRALHSRSSPGRSSLSGFVDTLVDRMPAAERKRYADEVRRRTVGTR